MPLYKAYGVLSKGGVARKPFLLDLLGTTPVSFHDGVNVPDADFIMGLIHPVDNGTTGTGVSLWINPRPGHDLTSLDVTVVILPTQDGQVLQGPTAPAGDRSLIVMQFQNGPLPVGSLIGQVGQITSAVYENDPAQPSAVPPLGADDRIDDEYQIEAWAGGAQSTLHLIGGLATGPLHPIDGTQIQATGPYKETATKILAIDLARVRPGPPSSAVSPTSATWFDVTAAPNGPSAQTHLKVIVGVPHAAAAPATAPTAAVSATPGSVLKGRYQYTVTYAHPYGTETSVGPLSNEVNLTADGSIAVAAIPTGSPPPAANPEYAVVARRIYRKGPGGGDAVLVGELPGPGAAHPPNPLPTTFIDSNSGIPIGGGITIASGEYRAPSRLRVRYSADTPLDVGGSVILVSAGAGSAGVDTYSGSVTAAPLAVEVVQDDRTGLRSDLRAATVERSRLRWTAGGRTPQITVALPALSIDPFGPGVHVRLDDAPAEFGFDWRLGGELLTVIDIRGRADLAEIADPAPTPDQGGPDTIGLAAVRLGSGVPAAAWPEGEASVGAEVMELDDGSYTAIAVRGLRWTAFTLGDGFPGPDDPNRLRVGLLVGADPANPPGGDRSLRFRRMVRHAPSDPTNPNLSWWGRVGVLPDRLSLDVQPVKTGLPQLGTQMNVTLAGAVERVVAQTLDDVALGSQADGGGSRLWLSVDATGEPVESSDNQGLTSLTVVHDDQDTRITSTLPLHVGAAASGLNLGNRLASAQAYVRVPTDVRVHLFSEPKDTLPPGQDQASDTQVVASPDGAWGRVAVNWGGVPLATRSNPQLRMRRLPDQPSAAQVDAVTARWLGLLGGELKVLPAPVGTYGPPVDPVSKLVPTLSLDQQRPNSSFRFEHVEVDGRVPGGARTSWKGRIGHLPDAISVEAHTADMENKLFFVNATTSEAMTGIVAWGEPAQFRDPAAPRGEFAGVGNLSALVDEVPTAFEYLNFDGLPFSKRGLPEYAAATLPRVHTPDGDTKQGGFRLKLTGSLRAPFIRMASFSGDEDICLDQTTRATGQWSKWSEVIVPVLNLRRDPAAASDAVQTLWVWEYDSPPPPPPGPPTNPCDGSPSGPDITSGKAFRISDGLLVDVAMRQYYLHDSPDIPDARWNQFTQGSFPVVVLVPIQDQHNNVTWVPETITVPFGTWDFDTDIQMKDYRGEVTIVDAGIFESLGNPYGDWEDGPGNWYLRAHDKLKIVAYTGDLYMGNTGNGFHVPLSTGIFSTLAAIYNITWP